MSELQYSYQDEEDHPIVERNLDTARFGWQTMSRRFQSCRYFLTSSLDAAEQTKPFRNLKSLLLEEQTALDTLLVGHETFVVDGSLGEGWDGRMIGLDSRVAEDTNLDGNLGVGRRDVIPVAADTAEHPWHHSADSRRVH